MLKCPCHRTCLVQHIYLLQTFVLNPTTHFLKVWDLWKMEIFYVLFCVLNWVGGSPFFITPLSFFPLHHHSQHPRGVGKLQGKRFLLFLLSLYCVWSSRPVSYLLHLVLAPFQNIRAFKILSTGRKSSLSHKQTEKTSWVFLLSEVPYARVPGT